MIPADSGPNSEHHWQYDVTDSTLLLAAAYVFPSVLGGSFVLGGVLIGWLIVTAIVDNAIDRAITLTVGAVLVLLSRRWLVPALATQTARPLHERYSTRGLALGSIVGATALCASSLIHSAGPIVVFVASWVPLLLTAGFPTEGRVNPATTTLVVDGDEIPVKSIRNYRSISFGELAVCWLSYAPGHPTAPRVVVVPDQPLDTVRSVLDWGSEQPVAESRSMGVAERRIVVLFGLGGLAVGPVLWVLLPAGDGRIIALYSGALFGSFGVILLWHAHHR